MLLILLFQIASFTAATNTDSEVIAKYLSAVRMLEEDRRSSDVEVTIQARLPKLSREATVRAVRTTSATGAIRYEIRDASGDAMVRREVIARYLAATSQTRTMDEVSITPSLYRFRLLRTMGLSHQIYVFRLTPKKKKVGLFKGELWVDGLTGRPVHESGQFVKNPSIFIKRIFFSRDYGTESASGLPACIHSTVETHIAGPAELTIRISDTAEAEARNAD